MMKFTTSMFTKLLCAGLLVCMTGCGTSTSAPDPKAGTSPQGKHTASSETKIDDAGYNLADMSGYKTYDASTDYRFIDSNIDEFFDLMEKKETFIAYIGFQDCKMCNQAMPILNDVAAKNDSYVRYINTSDEDDWKTSKVEVPILKFGEYLDGYLEIDSEGYPELYVPFVIFVKNGTVVMVHDGVPTEGGFNGALSEEQANELRSIYEEGFAKIAD